MADVFDWPVDAAEAAQEAKYAVRTVQFGDGYEQRQAKSLRRKTQTWAVAKTGLRDEIAAIEAFLDARARACGSAALPQQCAAEAGEGESMSRTEYR